MSMDPCNSVSGYSLNSPEYWFKAADFYRESLKTLSETNFVADSSFLHIFLCGLLLCHGEFPLGQHIINTKQFERWE